MDLVNGVIQDISSATQKWEDYKTTQSDTVSIRDMLESKPIDDEEEEKQESGSQAKEQNRAGKTEVKDRSEKKRNLKETRRSSTKTEVKNLVSNNLKEVQKKPACAVQKKEENQVCTADDDKKQIQVCSAEKQVASSEEETFYIGLKWLTDSEDKLKDIVSSRLPYRYYKNKMSIATRVKEEPNTNSNPTLDFGTESEGPLKKEETKSTSIKEKHLKLPVVTMKLPVQ